jgi:hypothetical protein
MLVTVRYPQPDPLGRVAIVVTEQTTGLEADPDVTVRDLLLAGHGQFVVISAECLEYQPL